MRYEMSPEAKKILEFLEPKPNQFSYDELKALTGLNDVTRLRGYLMTALRRQRKKGVWYQSIRGVGYALIDREDDKNPVQVKALEKIRRKVKTTNGDQALINVEALTRDGKLAYSFNSARIGALMQSTGREVLKEIERKIGNADLPIDGTTKDKT